MNNNTAILQLIKKRVLETEPGATIILFNSHAHGDEREDSDIDLLILVESEQD
jgi:predicted nucleotidyltransferase